MTVADVNSINATYAEMERKKSGLFAFTMITSKKRSHSLPTTYRMPFVLQRRTKVKSKSIGRNIYSSAGMTDLPEPHAIDSYF